MRISRGGFGQVQGVNGRKESGAFFLVIYLARFENPQGIFLRQRRKVVLQYLFFSIHSLASILGGGGVVVRVEKIEKRVGVGFGLSFAI